MNKTFTKQDCEGCYEYKKLVEEKENLIKYLEKQIKTINNIMLKKTYGEELALYDCMKLRYIKILERVKNG